MMEYHEAHIHLKKYDSTGKNFTDLPKLTLGTYCPSMVLALCLFCWTTSGRDPEPNRQRRQPRHEAREGSLKVVMTHGFSTSCSRGDGGVVNGPMGTCITSGGSGFRV